MPGISYNKGIRNCTEYIKRTKWLKEYIYTDDQLICCIKHNDISAMHSYQTKLKYILNIKNTRNTKSFKIKKKIKNKSK